MGKHHVFETDEVLLDFRGPDADKFVQVSPPKTPKGVVRFELTEEEFLSFIHPTRVGLDCQYPVESAEYWEIGQCEEGHTLLTLVNNLNQPFAEVHVGDENDVDDFILALIDTCRNCTIERLQKLL